MHRPSDERLREVFDTVEPYVENRWGIPVHIADVPNPFTGDLDGEQIIVDYDLELEDAVFILIHLFGHTVQWNVSASSRAVAFAAPAVWTPELLAAASAYEREAAGFSLQLLHDCAIRDLDQWLSDFAACDNAYLMHLYQTGEKRAFRTFWVHGTPLIAARAIPEFQPTRWLSRNDGIVV